MAPNRRPESALRARRGKITARAKPAARSRVQCSEHPISPMKTKSSLLLLGLLFSGAMLARADDTASTTPPPAASAHPHRAELLKRFDKNGDGKLDDAEKAEAKKFAQEHKGAGKDALLKKFDANGDGKLDETEKAAAKQWRKDHPGKGKGKGAAAETEDKPAAS